MVYTTGEIRDALIASIADVAGVTPQEVLDRISELGGDGHFELASKTAESAIAGLELMLGVGLPGPADLKREEFATISALLFVVVARLSQLGAVA